VITGTNCVGTIRVVFGISGGSKRESSDDLDSTSALVCYGMDSNHCERQQYETIREMLDSFG